jgi:hypothetical protein
MKVVIISRKRPAIACKTSLRLFPDALVSISEEDVEDYANAGVKESQMLVHPNEMKGVTKKRNWVLRNIEDETCVTVDDDLKGLICFTGKFGRHIKDPEDINQILLNSETIAKGIRTPMFSFSNVGTDIRKYIPHKPFHVVGYPTGVHGMIGRNLWYDEKLTSHEDVDMGLQVVRKYRIIWIDLRFSFFQQVSTGMMAGGRAGTYAKKDEVEGERYLKRKWGAHYKFSKWQKGTTKSVIVVQREQTGLILPHQTKA